MAINSTIHKVTLNIADMDRHYYQTHELTVAQHPSETDFRFMIRLMTFMLNADERLSFTRGLCSDDEPELWVKNLTDDIELWVDLGQPDEKRIRKACGRADKVIIYTYHQRKASVWWQQHKKKLDRFDNLTVVHIEASDLESMVQRTMQLQCNIQDGVIYVNDDNASCTVTQKKHG